jgi:hypothetical protein
LVKESMVEGMPDFAPLILSLSKDVWLPPQIIDF